MRLKGRLNLLVYRKEIDLIFLSGYFHLRLNSALTIIASAMALKVKL